MKRIGLAAFLLALAAVAGGRDAKRSVAFAPSWEAAVEEARALNVPVVVHSHGFYCPPCWWMHGAVLQGQKYIKFAAENTVEVVTVSQFDKGLAAKNRKTETCKVKGPSGQPVETLVEWPGLTIEQLRALNRSKAATYNRTGGVPHTAIVDPHTLEMREEFPGATSAKTLMRAITAHKKALEKEHGKSVSRKVLIKVKAKAARLRELVEKGELNKALAECAKLKKSVASRPAALQQIANTVRDEVRAAAGRKLDELEALIARGKGKEAARELGSLARALGGTRLEERAHLLLAKTKKS